jgi:oxygen-independent coproporphyrinogen-3 oxidase
MYRACRELGFASVNFDLIYGLPEQTPESFRRSMEAVVELRPDRVAVYSFAYVPWMRAQQKYIDVERLPAPEVKLLLFGIARDTLLSAGYVPIGMDHFALPGDEMVAAMLRGRLGRNFMGYTVRLGSDMVGVGVSSIGDVRGCMPQNVKKLSRYYEALDAGRLPVERGCLLDRDDEIRRAVILSLMCNFTLDVAEIERRFGIDFAAYFAPELAELRAPDGPVGHGFAEVAPDRIRVVGCGRLFVRNVCMIFDRYLRRKTGGAPVFSQTV